MSVEDLAELRSVVERLQALWVKRTTLGLTSAEVHEVVRLTRRVLVVHPEHDARWSGLQVVKPATR